MFMVYNSKGKKLVKESVSSVKPFVTELKYSVLCDWQMI